MLKISGTSQPNASFVSEGFYYCYTYVDIFDTSVVLYLHQSQMFEVFRREEYLQQSSSCSGRVFSTLLETCAVSVHASTTTSTFSEGPTPPLSSTVDSAAGTGGSGSGGSLEVWIYVLVAVFAMIIVILAIMFVGVCLTLRLSRIRNTNSLQCKFTQLVIH